MKGITIPREFVEEMTRHSLEVFPKEACGLLAGRGGEVTKLYRLRNADDSEITYALDPREQLSAVKEMEGEGLELLAIYHSHTGSPASPSATDVARAFFPGTREENFPGVAYVIAGVTGKSLRELRAFLIEGRGVEEIEIRQSP
ncbi:MAG: M67 family metallopeptidase [Nitrospirota bacterium]|jgi:proteasome lid subunit RPN8/RPN11